MFLKKVKLIKDYPFMLKSLYQNQKSFFITFLCLLMAISGFAQSNFYKLSLGGGVGVTQSFTDVEKHSLGGSIYGTADYYFTPFISLGIEGQIGQINGGSVTTDPSNRQFINNYKSATINGKIFLGNFIDYSYSQSSNLLKGFYFGSGIGVIKNSMKDIVRYKDDDKSTVGINESYTFPGQNNSYNVDIPLNIGLNVYFADYNGNYRYTLNFNFQSNITIGEGLDGYNDSSIKFRNNNPDIYNFLSVGVKYNFGTLGFSNKTFRKP
jgi:hypothetical protein